MKMEDNERLPPQLSSFSILDKVGALDEVLATIKNLNVSLSRIESRPSRNKNLYDFYVDFDAASEAKVIEVVNSLGKSVNEIRVVSTGEKDTSDGKHINISINHDA